ncbi:MAG: class I SAM-dependent methyltransferase [Solirubrobacterales bacterium]
MPSYDEIGRNYAEYRREDPSIRDAILSAIDGCELILNVGAGAGSYEPTDRQVTAVEPSAVMRAQRPTDRGPAIDAGAQDLPFADGSFDAAMSILSLHHWHPDQERGVSEMRRVAGRVVIVTVDPAVSGSLWLAEYLPEVAALDRLTFPDPRAIATWIGEKVSIEVLPIGRDCEDWMLLSYWAHPERMLDADARSATSGLARQGPEVIDRAVTELAADLKSGEWDRRWGELRKLDALDAGLRLIASN